MTQSHVLRVVTLADDLHILVVVVVIGLTLGDVTSLATPRVEILAAKLTVNLEKKS